MAIKFLTEPDPFLARTKFISDLANELLEGHGLTGNHINPPWRFEFHRKKNAVGTCSFSKRTIMFSEYYIHNSDEEIRDTLLHEIAHALVGPSHGHDYVWMRMAISVGARPHRCAPPEVTSTAKYRYEITCPTCPKKWYRHRLKAVIERAVCPSCKVKLRIRELH